MDDLKNTCALHVREMLLSVTQEEELQSAKRFAAFMDGLYPIEQMDRSEKFLEDGGLALSSLHAAQCVNDFLRTTRFIKGVHHAMQDLRQKHPDRKIHVLYAGTGPYATLVLPLMTILDERNFDLFLLDFHQVSIDNCRNFAERLDLDLSSMQFIHADAIHYTAPVGVTFDLLISETMFDALTREPQVAIITNLSQYLDKEGILIPESIDISLHHSNWGLEPHLNTGFIYLNPELTIQPQRILIGEVFRFNRTMADSLREINPVYASPVMCALQSAVKMPDFILLTSVKIYNDQVLNSCDSTISNPICIGNTLHTGHSPFRLKYIQNASPEWKLELIPAEVS